MRARVGGEGDWNFRTHILDILPLPSRNSMRIITRLYMKLKSNFMIIFYP
jgi:hypothetical protein